MTSGTPEHEEAQELAGLARTVADRLLTLESDFARTGVVPEAVPQALRDMGAYGLTIPEKYGGLGLSLGSAVRVLEELSRIPRAFFRGVGVNNGIASRALVLAGSVQQKERFLTRLASGEWLGAFALTEADAGSDVAAIRTAARPVAHGYVLNGTKQYITNGADADVVTVLAYTDRSAGAREGMTLFLVERGFEGFTATPAFQTMEGKPDVVAALTFEDCFVPRENILGEVGQGYHYALGDLTESRIQISAQAVGMSQRLVELAVEYSRSREAFGQPIGSFQTIRHMVADCFVDIHASRALVHDVANRHDLGQKVKGLAAIAKLHSTEALGRVADRTVQIHGGAGYVSDFPVERMYREARLLRIVEGTSEIQREIIAREFMR